MKKAGKYFLVTLLIAALVAGLGYGGWTYSQKKNRKEVPVYPVASLSTEVYMMDNNLEGSISTSVYQNINVDEDIQVKEVFVQEGDHVKKGDKLVEFDMVLLEMEQNINNLTLQSYEQNLQKALGRLHSLQNGGPIEDSSYSGLEQLPSMPGTSLSGGMDMMKLPEAEGENGLLLAAAFRTPILLAMLDEESGAFSEEAFEESASGTENVEPGAQAAEPPQMNSGEEVMPWESYGLDPYSSEGDFWEEDIFSDSGFEEGDPFPEEPVSPTEAPGEPSVTPEPTGTVPEKPSEETGIPKLYTVLDENAVPYRGTGTESDPYVFLCDADAGKVIARGSFLNLMAGYNPAGTGIVHEGGYWFSLQFYYAYSFQHMNAGISGDSMDEDFFGELEDLEGSQGPESLEEEVNTLCVGYYRINGGEMQEPMKPGDEVIYYLDRSTIPDSGEDPEEDLDDILGGGWYYSDTPTTTTTREEAIRQQKRTVNTLQLDVRKLNLNIRKLERKLQKKVICSSIDGVIKSIGDTAGSGSSAFMVVESDEGYYIRGTVSEMYLDQFVEGTKISCYSYSSGQRFEAEVRSVSDYPVKADEYSMWSSGNSNASSYEFMAYVLDQSLQLNSSDWLSISFKKSAAEKASLNIIQAFVRSEDGQSYVYKAENGVLKKQIVKAGASKDGGYSVPISGGITASDHLAFPYGKDVKDGAVTREASVDELYEY